MSDASIPLVQGRVTLALHPLQRGEGLPLLLLHALGGSRADWNGDVRAWPGPVHALDFSGHGASGWVKGGGYSPELLVADADAALAHLGPLCLLGAGLGAYVALLLAGTRPDAVHGALLLPGSGLAGCGPLPDFDADRRDFLELDDDAAVNSAAGHDPCVRSMANDPRPLDYVVHFAARAKRLLLQGDGDGAAWWKVARDGPTAESAPDDLAAALRQLAG